MAYINQDLKISNIALFGFNKFFKGPSSFESSLSRRFVNYGTGDGSLIQGSAVEAAG